MTDSEYSYDYPNRGNFKEMAVVIEVGSYAVKVYDVESGSMQLVPPKLLKRNTRVYGEDAIRRSKHLGSDLVSPFNKGTIKDWELLLAFLSALRDGLTEKAVVIAESTPYQSNLELRRFERKKLAQKLITNFHIEGYFVAPQPLFALSKLEGNINFRQRNGVVIDIGHSETRISVIYRGNTIHTCGESTDIAGAYFNELLEKEITIRQMFYDKVLTNFREEIKHENCLVLDRGVVNKKYLQLMKNKPKLLKQYERDLQLSGLPMFKIDQERFIVPEVLFNPTIISSGYDETHSLPSMFKRSKASFEKFRKRQRERNNPDYETDQAKSLFSKIFIVGGSSKIPGMIERIRSEIEHIFVMEYIEMNELNKEEAYETVKNDMIKLDFRYTQERDERGMEAFDGARMFVDQSENQDWLYAVRIEREADLVVERCPK